MSDKRRDLQRALSGSPDTVTHFLEALTGEALVADVVGQSQFQASADHNLDVDAGKTLVHRTAVLKGLSTDTRYVIAESTYVPDRLPGLVRARLVGTNDTIGRALIRAGLRVERRALSRPDHLGVPATQAIATPPSDIVWARAYLLMVDGNAAFAVHEWFLGSVLEAFERKALGAATR